MISPDDKQFIEAHRHHYGTLIRAEFLGNLDGSVLNRMLEIIKKHFAPAYLANLWCQPCVADMVKYLYTQYDVMPIIKAETFPKHDEPEVITEPKKRGRKPKVK